MEKDTIVLSLKDYNELRDFKNRITNGEFLIATKIYRNGIHVDTYKAQLYTENVTIKMLTDANKNLTDEVIRLTEELYPTEKELTLKDVKEMSYWEFRKWKKTK